MTGDEVCHRNLYGVYAFEFETPISNCVQPIWGNTLLQFCTHFKVGLAGYNTDNNCFSINGNGFLVVQYNSMTTEEDLKAYLKQQYEAGTPVKIYYKLETPVDLELTPEQKAIQDTKLYTYKNITNIDASDELASIDVNYKKDPTTEHDELQNQIDEIKQLISTTETSALLLDNLQKDVESEVE